MERDELLGLIARTTERLARAQTEFEREKARIRLDELKAQLRKLDNPPPRVEDPRAAEAIKTIREILGMKKG